MGNRVINNPSNNRIVPDSEFRAQTTTTETQTKPEITPSFSADGDSRRYENGSNTRLLREQLNANLVQNKTEAATDADLNARADKLAETFAKYNKPDYQTIAPMIEGLSAADVKKLLTVYQQKTGRDLRCDAVNQL